MASSSSVIASAFCRRRRHLQYTCCANEGHLLTLCLTQLTSISYMLKRERSTGPASSKGTVCNLFCRNSTTGFHKARCRQIDATVSRALISTPVTFLNGYSGSSEDESPRVEHSSIALDDTPPDLPTARAVLTRHAAVALHSAQVAEHDRKPEMLAKLVTGGPLVSLPQKPANVLPGRRGQPVKTRLGHVQRCFLEIIPPEQGPIEAITPNWDDVS